MGKGILEVKLVDAKGLLNTEAIGKMDPYVVIQYRNQEKTSSVARGQGTNPTWNETFKFLVQYSGDNSQHKLILRIMDQDTFTADDFVGQATINVADVILLGMENGKGELHTCKHRVVLADQTYCGEIRVGVTFTPKVDEDTSEELGGWRDSFHY
ncbi:elicitor-responsive protein 1 isoform X2 [Asparagus officinalis]|uniref:elicitor-responsive protein 1 isoform X2 n=1 Tax=Asparagus officinalis TaxID=4686 RepID=UPI00098E1614|nr:elicitor-responsive protein 1 isoform X2 [Asparagus officinalis]